MFFKDFLGRLPHKPYCTDDLRAGLRIRPLSTALKCLYIQVNPPGLCWVMVFDVDHKTGWRTAQEAGLPTPTWQTFNPDNGHSHIAYALTVPVCTSGAAHLAPLRYLAAIEAIFRRHLDADPLYTGLITKNPDRIDYWDVGFMDRLDGISYTMAELAGGILPELREWVKKERPAGEIAGLGRNCYVFETVRLWAYRAIREHWDDPAWEQVVYNECATVNCEFSSPLYDRELGCIARSIAGWTRRHFRPEEFSEFQRRSAARRWGPSGKKNGLELLRIGVDVQDVASVCGVHITTVRRWRAEAEPERQTITALEPWEAEGISRATWYRKHKGIV